MTAAHPVNQEDLNFILAHLPFLASKKEPKNNQ